MTSVNLIGLKHLGYRFRKSNPFAPSVLSISTFYRSRCFFINIIWSIGESQSQTGDIICCMIRTYIIEEGGFSRGTTFNTLAGQVAILHSLQVPKAHVWKCLCYYFKLMFGVMEKEERMQENCWRKSNMTCFSFSYILIDMDEYSTCRLIWGCTYWSLFSITWRSSLSPWYL